MLTVIVQGAPDTRPLHRSFDYNTDTISAKLESIRKHLINNIPLNFDETILLLATFVLESTDHTLIQSQIRKILLPHQVMIGVPESIHNMTFHIKGKTIIIREPITIQSYSMSGETN